MTELVKTLESIRQRTPFSRERPTSAILVIAAALEERQTSVMRLSYRAQEPIAVLRTIQLAHRP